MNRNLLSNALKYTNRGEVLKLAGAARSTRSRRSHPLHAGKRLSADTWERATVKSNIKADRQSHHRGRIGRPRQADRIWGLTHNLCPDLAVQRDDQAIAHAGEAHCVAGVNPLNAVELHPVTQAIAACIIPRDPTLMDFAPRRLADDQESSGARQLENGSGTKRQIGQTDLTSANFAQ